jgi:hypothetical protein
VLIGVDSESVDLTYSIRRIRSSVVVFAMFKFRVVMLSVLVQI